MSHFSLINISLVFNGGMNYAVKDSLLLNSAKYH